MIVWDFNVIIALSISLALAIVLGVWIFYTKRKDMEVGTSQDYPYLKQCSFCTYLFVDYLKRDHVRCPRCGSYLGNN